MSQYKPESQRDNEAIERFIDCEDRSLKSLFRATKNNLTMLARILKVDRNTLRGYVYGDILTFIHRDNNGNFILLSQIGGEHE